MEEERLRIRVNTSGTATAERELAGLEAKADAATRDRTIHIDIETKSLDAAIGRLERSLTSFGSRSGGGVDMLNRFNRAGMHTTRMSRQLGASLGFLKFPAVAAGGNLAASGVAALATGITGLTAALGPAVGLLGVVPGLFGAIGQGAAGIVGAVSGVGDVFTALSNAEKVAEANTRYGTGVDDLRRQERALALAQREAVDAQDALARARIMAARDLEDAELSLEQSYLSEARAVRALEQAQARLARGRDQTAGAAMEHVQFTDDFTGKVFDAIRITGSEVPDSTFSESDALLDLKQAELDLKRIRTDRARQEQDIIDLQRRGVEGHEMVTDAVRRLADAQYNLHEASLAAATGLTEAQKAANEVDEAMKDMHPSVRTFADFIRGDVKDAFVALRYDMQGELFPGLTMAVAGAMTNFDVLAVGMRETSRTVSDFFGEVADWTTSPEFRDDLGSILAINNDLLGDMAGLALDVADGFMELVITAEPLLDWFGELATRSGRLFNTWAEDNTGELADFFERTIEVSDLLFDSLGNTYRTLRNIGSAAEPLATWLLESLRDVTAAQEEWTGSAEGIKTMQDYFERMRAPLSEIAGLTSDIARGLFEIGTPEKLDDMVELLREDLVPSLINFFDAVDDGFGPATITALGHFVDLFTTLVDDGGGGLTSFVETLGDMAQALNWFIDNIPGLDKIIGLLLTLKGVNMAFNLTGLTRLTGAVGMAGGTFGGLIETVKTTGTSIDVDLARTAKAGEGFGKRMGSVMGEVGHGAKTMGGQIREAINGPAGVLATITLAVTAFQMWGDMMKEARLEAEALSDELYGGAISNLQNTSLGNTADTLQNLIDTAKGNVNQAASQQVGFFDQLNPFAGKDAGSLFDWMVGVDDRKMLEEAGKIAEETATRYEPLIQASDRLAQIMGITREKAVDFVVANDNLGISFDSTSNMVASYIDELERLNNEALQNTYDTTVAMFSASLSYELQTMDAEDAVADYKDEQERLALELLSGKISVNDYERATIRVAQSMEAAAVAAVEEERRVREAEGGHLGAAEASRIHREKLLELSEGLSPESPLMQRIQRLIDQFQIIENTDLQNEVRITANMEGYLKDLKALKEAGVGGWEFQVKLSEDIRNIESLVHRRNYPNVSLRPDKRVPGSRMPLASGGRYRAGMNVLTGEIGAELQIPDRGGYVMNNTDTAALLTMLREFLASGGGNGRPVKIDQHFYEKIDPAAVGRETAWAVD